MKCVIFTVTLIVCSIGAYVSAKPRIVGGQEARAAQFPWQAAVYVDTLNGKFFCGGALITAQYVLTAGHCVYGARMWTIHLGSNTLQNGDPNRLILATSNGLVHPDFVPTTLENDVGLLKFHIAVEFTDYIRPINIANMGQIQENMMVTVSGWGQTDDQTPGIINDLQFTDLTIISNAECSITYGDQIKSNMVCAVGNYNQGICIGDTGSPLVKPDVKGNPLHVGIASFYSGNGCMTPDPSGYVRTDLYHKWISEVTKAP